MDRTRLAIVLSASFTLFAFDAHAFEEPGAIEASTHSLQSAFSITSPAPSASPEFRTDLGSLSPLTAVWPPLVPAFEAKKSQRALAGYEEEALGGRLDAPVLPFLNLYGMVSWRRHTWSELSLEGDAEGDPVARFFPYDREREQLTYGGGGVLAGGWRQFFASVDTQFTLTDLDEAAEPVSALTVAPRVGARGSSGAVQGILWLGAMYRKLDRLEGEFDVPGVGSVPLAVDFDIDKPWNMMLGTGLKFRDRYRLTLDGGFLGRKQLTLGFKANF